MKRLTEGEAALNELTLPWVPDPELLRCLTDHGMPREAATSTMLNAGFRLFATSFYFDVIEARKGDKEAKERVDLCRHSWSERAKRERKDARKVSASVPRRV